MNWRQRATARMAADVAVGLALIAYEARRVGLREALRPRWMWNLPERRQKVAYVGLVAWAVTLATANALNEAELRERDRAAPR